MKVLWVLKGLGLGGAERLLLELAPHMPSVTFLPVAVSGERPDIATQFGERGFEPQTLGSTGHFHPRWIIGLRRMIRHERPDVLHLHLPYPGVGGRIAALGLDVPIVYTEHSPWHSYHPVTRWANGLTFTMNDAIIAVSHDVEASILASPLGRRSRNRILVIPNGIDPDQVRVDAVRALPDFIPAGSYGSITALSRRKAVGVLVDAAALLAEEFPDRRCIIVGGGEDLDEMRRRVERHGPATVAFLGSRTDARAIMAQLAVVILSSRWEGLPLALLEAMSLGKPVVASRVGGVPEVIEDGVNGLLVPAGDSAALAAAVTTLLRDRELASQLGAAARTTIEERWHVRSTASRLLDVYKSVLGSERAFVGARRHRAPRPPT